MKDKSSMIKSANGEYKQISKNFEEFIKILEESNFQKEEFLFHCKPYIHGLFEIFRKVENFMSLKGMKVLDLGCGTGLTTYLLHQKGAEVTGIDIYDQNEEIQQSFKNKGKASQQSLWDNLKRGKKKLNYRFYEGKIIPFENNSFELVFAHAVIEHVPKEFLKITLGEIYRILKKDGYLVIARTPNKFSWAEFLTKCHQIKFSKDELFEICGPDNYELVSHEMTDFFPEVAPGGFQIILNNMLGVTKYWDRILNASPFQKWSHHHFFVLKKK
jgi:ubiquinone/menaquinone biosynthesis C-methylase UbiE